MPDFTFPLNEIYVAYGDGSSGEVGTFYGLVLVPVSRLDEIESQLQEIKVHHGGQKGWIVHAREIFCEHARAKSVWAHLSYEGAVSLCGDILNAVSTFEPKYLMSFIPKSHYPKRFRLKGKNGHQDLVHDVNDKWLQLWAYFRVGGLLDPCNRIEPDDSTIKLRPKNLPFWNMVIRRTDPGLRVQKVYLDRENTKITWFSKSLQWISVAKELVIENVEGSTYLPIVHATDYKPMMLDVADVFTYSITREFSGDKSIDYCNYCGEVFIDVLPKYEEEIVLGGWS